jgi:eukaryotic-like serine/threonine-protein kinase
MAEVFIASTMGAEGFSRRVAIKRVLPGYSENPQFAQMFISEAQISSRLEHHNIVSVLDFDRDNEGRLFLVMELVEGKDLDAVLSTGLLPFPAVIFILTEMLSGLGYAHDLPAGVDTMRGIVHRDVSPHNVLLSWEGAVKVSDFGIAKAREASEATASVFIKGKPAYMSPEQANGEALDGRSDLFAVGVMLWEMLVGRRLFVGGDTRSLLAQVLFSPIPRPRQQRADVPRDLDQICMKMLERELPARYANAEEIITDLRRCEDGPRASRAEVVGLLADRFGAEFPQRQSRRLNSRPMSHQNDSAIPTPLPSDQLTPYVQTLPSGSPARPSAPLPLVPPPGYAQASAVPASVPPTMMGVGGAVSYPGSAGLPPPATPGSLDQMMAANTRTLARPRRSPSVGLVIGGTLGAVAIVAIVLTALLSQGSSKTAAGVDASTVANAAGSTASGAAPGGDTRPDAGAIDARPARDAAPAHDGSGTSGDDKPATKPASRRGSANITFSTDPPMDLYVDGRPKGTTPKTLRLEAGAHKIKVVNSDTGAQDRFEITVEADKNRTVAKSYP